MVVRVVSSTLTGALYCARNAHAGEVKHLMKHQADETSMNRVHLLLPGLSRQVTTPRRHT